MITVGILRNKVTKLFLGSEGRLLAEVMQAATEAAFWMKGICGQIGDPLMVWE